MTIGEKIRDERKKAGLTQGQLAEKLDVSQAMVAQYENNIRNPKLSTIQKIASALRLTVSELLTFDSEKGKIIDLTSLDTIEQVNQVIKEIMSGTSKIITSDSEKVIDVPSEKLEQLMHKDEQGKTSIAIYADQVVSLSNNEFKLLLLFDLLNIDGQEKALEQIELLTKIQEYREE